ncbi:MAG TPA: hypothetical protein VN048_09415, partial [Verrucomicrobiae bacterium]|nr:hypothetical protein [Verrucomicrobiae bacterium]
SGLSFIKIDEKLYALVASSFSFKFYCAGGRGYSFTVTVAPTYTPTWNAKDEWGFPWLAKYIGKHSWIHERYGNLGAFSQGFADLAGILPEYFEVLNKPKPAFWDSFNGFVANEIARNQKSK